MDLFQIATVAATVIAALVVGTFSYIGVRHTVRDRARRIALTRQQEAERILRKYRDPLIRSAFDLQSRLFNIMRNDFLRKYLVDGTRTEKEYALESTLYVIAEYFCWVEIMRREVQFLDLRDIDRNRAIAEKLERITELFAEEGDDARFRVFRAEQRAIGEVTIVPSASGGRESIGYAAFVQRRNEPDFSRWFENLKVALDALASVPGPTDARLASIQGALIDLIDELDPKGQYFPDTRLLKLMGPSAPVSHVATKGPG